MPKPNTYVQLLQAQKAIKQLQYDNHVIKGFTVQQCLDVALIALHNEFHFGPKMSTRFESAFLDIQFEKHVAPKIITPEQNQSADAYKFGYRNVGIADVYENKVAGIYLHHKAKA